MLMIGCAVLAYALACAVLGLSMRHPAAFSAIARWLPGPAFMLLPMQPLWDRARAGGLAPGDLAPDFDLPRADEGGRVQLAPFRGKRPVLLVFGSYT